MDLLNYSPGNLSEDISRQIFSGEAQIRPEVGSISTTNDHLSADPESSCKSRIPQSLFPINALPDPMKEMVEAVSRMHRAPVGLCAACALATVSAAIGKGLKVQSLPGLTTPANLYILVGASSGVGKSLAFKELTAPLREYQRLLEALNGGDDAKQKTIDTLEKTIEAINVELAEAATTEERRVSLREQLAQEGATLAGLNTTKELNLLCEDTTPAALAMLLDEGDECLASFSPDARDIANRLSAGNQKNRATVEGILLKAYTEEPHRIDRASRPSIDLNAPNLTCLWLLQPDLLLKLFDNTALTESGLLCRFLVHSVDMSPTYINRQQQSANPEVTKAWEQLVAVVLKEYRLGEERRIVISEPQPVELMDAHYNRGIDFRLSDGADVGTYVARWNENAWRTALVLHTAKYGGEAHSKQLELETVQNAIRIVDWFAAEQLKILEAKRDQSYREAQARVFELLEEKADGVTAREIQRARIAATASEAAALLTRMVDDRKLTPKTVEPEGGGKKMVLYTKA